MHACTCAHKHKRAHACIQAQKQAATAAAKAQERERERLAKAAAQQDRAQQQRMGDVMKNVFGTSGGFKPKIKIKVSNPGAAGARPPPAATRGAARATGSMAAPPADPWLNDAMGARLGESDDDLDLDDLNSDDSMYIPSPQHSSQPKAGKGAKAGGGSKAKGGSKASGGGAAKGGAKVCGREDRRPSHALSARTWILTGLPRCPRPCPPACACEQARLCSTLLERMWPWHAIRCRHPR